MFDPVKWAKQIFSVPPELLDVDEQRRQVQEAIAAHEVERTIRIFRALEYCADVIAVDMVTDVPHLDRARVRTVIARELGMAVADITEPLRMGIELS